MHQPFAPLMLPPLKIILLLALLAFWFPAQAQSEEDGRPYSLNDEMMVNHLLGTWESMLTYECIPPENKKNAAVSAYGLMFQLWLIPKFKPDFLSKHIIKGVLNPTSKPYIDDMNDPLLIKQYYEDGRLKGDGLIKARWLMLNDAANIFADEKNYDRKVTKFLQWIAITNN